MNNFIEASLKADINISTQGDNTIIAAPTGQGEYIAIDYCKYMVASAVTVQMKDGTTNYGGALPLAAQQASIDENASRNEHGVITMSPNQAFVMNLSSPVQVSGFIRYRIVGR